MSEVGLYTLEHNEKIVYFEVKIKRCIYSMPVTAALGTKK